ncbi:MAG: hypothetical protein OEW21_04190 [Betaproteobacteria bacterium]|nr:hypothetical protein [Betaproteobacteria bacterium]
MAASDFRRVRAFPVLNDGSELDRMYRENAERILLQSVAAATMSAHRAAAALGYNLWWVTAIGQERAQLAMKPLLGIPEEFSVIEHPVFRQGGEAAIQALEEKPCRDHELEPRRPRAVQDRGADRRAGGEHPAQGDVPGRGGRGRAGTIQQQLVRRSLGRSG